jgi:bifunctional polynucleotide phosphatase/kinase
MGYRLVLFTNQYARSESQVTKKLARVQTFLTSLNLPMTAFVATSKNEYRKPEIGAWNYFKSNNNVTRAFFCGDALGRHGDWNNSDAEFAKNAGIEIQEPEKLFPPVEIQISTHKPQMVVFIGMPGCGKSTFYRNYFADFIHVSRDVLGTKYKVMKKLKHCCENNLNVVVDNTNPSQKGREEFYNLARGYEISVIYFVNNGRGHNSTRDTPVKDIAYHMYFKRLEPPDAENTPGKIWRVDGMTASLNK